MNLDSKDISIKAGRVNIGLIPNTFGAHTQYKR